MEKIKKLILSLILIMVISVSKVKAYNFYNTYNPGDEITVILNDSLKSSFYVVEDDDDSVKAIYNGILGEDIAWEYSLDNNCTFTDSVVEQALKERTKIWDNVSYVTLPAANEITSFDYSSQKEFEELGTLTNPAGGGMIHLESLNNVPFYALNNETGTEYYTKSVMTWNDSNGTSCNSYVYGYSKTEFPYLFLNIPDGTEYASIRPLIWVSKYYVEDGINKPKDWNEFAKLFAEFVVDEGYGKINVYHDNNNLTMSDGDVTDKYIYENGILKLISKNNYEESMEWLMDEFISSYILDFETCGVYCTCTEEEIDGKHYSKAIGDHLKYIAIYSEEENIDLVDTYEVDLAYFFNFEREEINEKNENTVENPDTGINLGYSLLVLIILISGIAYMIIRKQSKFLKHN